MTRYTSFCVFIFFAFSLIIPSGYSYGMVLLIAGGIALFFKSHILVWIIKKSQGSAGVSDHVRGCVYENTQPKDKISEIEKNDTNRIRKTISINKEDYYLIAIFLCYFLVALISNGVNGTALREYDQPARFILAIPVLFLLRTYPPSAASFWAGLGCGAIGAGLFAAWQNLALNNARPGGYTNPIQFGDISIVLGILCGVGLVWAWSRSRHSKFWSIFLSIGALMGILGAIFSQSRGAWLSLPLAILILSAYYRAYFKYIKITLFALSLGILAIAWLLRVEIKNRIEQAAIEAQNYFVHDKANSSIGIRLELWRTALIIIPEHLWLGFSKSGYLARQKTLVEQRQADRAILNYDHIHNELLDVTVKRGILGLGAMLALYGVPSILFMRSFQKNSSRNVYAVAGVSLIFSYLAFGLTGSSMTHNNLVITLLFSIIILWSLLKQSQHIPPPSVSA